MKKLKWIIVTLLILGLLDIFLSTQYRNQIISNDEIIHRTLESVGKNFSSYLDKWNLAFLPNPVFGYTLNPNQVGVNNFGFRSKYQFPYVKKSNEIVIGLYGGSIADGIAEELELSLNAKNVSAKKIIILNFAIGINQQPFTLFQLLHSIDWVDRVIVLDGVLDKIKENNYESNYPIEFGTFYPILYSMNDHKAKELSDIYSMLHWQKRLSDLLEANPIFLKSYIGSSFFRSLVIFTNKDIKNTLKRLKENTKVILKKHDEDSEQVKINSWLKYTLQMQAILLSNKKPAIYFLEPFQSNKMSPGFNKKLDSALLKLSANGINYNNLMKTHNLNSNAFQQDGYHLNAKENSELVVEIKNEIVK